MSRYEPFINIQLYPTHIYDMPKYAKIYPNIIKLSIKPQGPGPNETKCFPTPCPLYLDNTTCTYCV